jgi:UDP-N-acetyl-D-mannosaminuronic acid dehydrogenase
MKVAVIGAAGHVGFPFSLVLADAGHSVIGIDRNPVACSQLLSGFSPHIEEGANDLLLNMLKANRVTYTTDDERIQECDAVAIMIGTPIDGEGNPRLDDILDFVRYTLAPQLNENMLIVLRSTVAPGTTDLIESILLEETSLKFHVVFAPERVAQGVGIVESKKFPQLIGARTKEAFDLAVELFNFVPECSHLTPREAEFGKLATNMYRYVTFALANEFYMIGTDQGLDVHKVIDAVNKDYPRMSLPKPGPNVGGPCLFKDGKFLLEDVPYADLIQVSFLINEGMPKYMFDRILKTSVKRVNKIGILGATFKADCDDVRNSLSFKFAKICKRHGIEYAFFDPYIAHPDNVWPTHDINDYDAFVVMTPHRQFQKFYDEHISKRKSVVIADGWKYLHSSKETIDGVYVI